MKKEISKKKLGFKKTFVANLDQHEAVEIQGGGGTTYSDTPCICSHTCATAQSVCHCGGDTTIRYCDLSSGAAG
ncbi:MAG: hypothetical protein J0L99_12990 [Chitinophagales bacterium]|nr:hypothetical protein [Chitinophagales bacterium]